MCLCVKCCAICSILLVCASNLHFKTSICCHSISPANVQRNIIWTFQILQLNIPSTTTFYKTSLQILNHLANIFEDEGLKHKINKWSIKIDDLGNLDMDLLFFVLTLARKKCDKYMVNFIQTICTDFQKWMCINFKCFVFVLFYVFCLCLCLQSESFIWLIG